MSVTRTSTWPPATLTSPPRQRSVQVDWFERALDVVLAIAALVFTAPLLLAMALLIKLQDGGPVFFAQTRIGHNGRLFRCYKFRSMVVDAQSRLEELLAIDPLARAEWEKDHKLKNDPRITRIGGFLRRSSLDELPQMLNILRGDMSWVGPRPIVHAEIAKYGRWYRYYVRTKPGLTGMWQVSGRNDVNYRRRVALDIMFTRGRSLRLYVYIVAMTVPAVLSRKGTY